jgi:hypothetical protein
VGHGPLVGAGSRENDRAVQAESRRCSRSRPDARHPSKEGSIGPRTSHRAAVAAGARLAVAPAPACIRRGRTAGRQRCPDVRVRRSRQPTRDPDPDTLAPHTGTRPAARPQPRHRETPSPKLPHPGSGTSKMWGPAGRLSIPRSDRDRGRHQKRGRPRTRIPLAATVGIRSRDLYMPDD